jgi:acyl carrier protein
MKPQMVLAAGRTRPTLERVAEIVVLTCDVPRERITAECNLLNDLGIDSLGILEVAFAVENAFGVAIPIDRWLHAIHMGQTSSDQYFVMKEFCGKIDALVVAATA